jgi:hypothetical protein
MIFTKTPHISCDKCIFALPDPTCREKNWIAYECGNPESVYYTTLLNITPEGNTQSRITWKGCELGEPAEFICKRSTVFEIFSDSLSQLSLTAEKA